MRKRRVIVEDTDLAIETGNHEELRRALKDLPLR
jgi:hypothetical protein